MITYTLELNKLRDQLRAQLRKKLVAQCGPPRRKMALMARKVGCRGSTIGNLFTDNSHLPTRIISRFTDSLRVSEEVRVRWTSAAQLIEWATKYQANKASATKRMRALNKKKDLPLWSRWIAGRLADLDWSLTDLSRALGHKWASISRKKGGGMPPPNIPGIVQGRIVPRDFHKIERVLGQAPTAVKRAVRIDTRKTYAASARLGNRSIKRTRSRWTKHRLTNEVHRMLSGKIPTELRNRIGRLDPNKPVGVEGYRIYASASGFAVNLALKAATNRLGVKKMSQSQHKSQTITARVRLAQRLSHLEKGDSVLLQCPGCLELQVRGQNRAWKQCRSCWHKFMRTPAYNQWVSERRAALSADRSVPPLPPPPKKSGRRLSSGRLRECLVVYLQYALGRLDNDERLDRKDDLKQAGRLLATTRNRRAREVCKLTEELLP